MDVPTRLTVDPSKGKALSTKIKQALRNEVKLALLDDPFWGDRIRPDKWPKRFKKLPNLFRFELPDAHRGVYSVLTHPGRDREIRIVWLGNHESYDRLFGYHTS